MNAEEIRGTRFECDDGNFESARWLQEVAAELAELNDQSMRPLRWQVQALQEELPRLRRDLGEAIRQLGQTIERATAPWYIRIVWHWKAKRQAREIAEARAEWERQEKDRHDKLIEMMKNRGTNSRFKSRFS